MEFAKWLQTQEAYGNEEPVISRLQGQDFASQAQTDKNLHKDAVGKGRFDPAGEKFLSHDTQTKTDFQKIVRAVEGGQQPDPDLVQKTIAALEFDMKVHGQYLGQPENPNTGSHDWHNSWLGTYQKWVAYLRNLT